MAGEGESESRDRWWLVGTGLSAQLTRLIVVGDVYLICLLV